MTAGRSILSEKGRRKDGWNVETRVRLSGAWYSTGDMLNNVTVVHNCSD